MNAWENYRHETMLSGHGKFGPYTHYLKGIPMEFAQKQIALLGHIPNVHDMAWNIEMRWKQLNEEQRQQRLKAARQEYLNSLIED